METTQIEKKRLTIYLNPDLYEWLWHKRVETSRPVSEIAENLMERQRGEDTRHKTKTGSH